MQNDRALWSVFLQVVQKNILIYSLLSWECESCFNKTI